MGEEKEEDMISATMGNPEKLIPLTYITNMFRIATDSTQYDISDSLPCPLILLVERLSASTHTSITLYNNITTEKTVTGYCINLANGASQYVNNFSKDNSITIGINSGQSMLFYLVSY